MNIKDVIISRTNSDSEVKAIASVAFDNGMTVCGIKIIEIEGAPFTSIPVTEVWRVNSKVWCVLLIPRWWEKSKVPLKKNITSCS